ncbi:class I SAM-dependent methyltransferase [Winogradskyella sp.]|uniref:class I SAM-dependent methyltransferase n=1 Tax=Winogradskyella sp. TaxID=1883156 RepID=UPI00260346F1|nr:methyltransferase domain-containing protein [Winogradskyella sp.]
MNKIVVIAALFLCLGCHNNHHETATDQLKEHSDKHHGDKHAKKHGPANEFMHQTPVKDLIERFESPERDDYQKPEKVLNYLGDLQGYKIMDIGAGSGYFSVKLAEKGATVIAADVDDEFLNFIQDRIDTDNLKHIETRKIPYNSPNLKESEVDMVLIVNTYHHIENRSDYFSKVKMGTKEDGELVIIDFFKTEAPVGPPANHKISIDVVIAELKEAGYTNFVVNVDLLPYQYIIKAK